MTCDAPTFKNTSIDVDIEEANVMIIIAPPSVEYVSQRPTILGKPTTNLSVICDTLVDFISHQAQSIKEIQHLVNAYTNRPPSARRLSPQRLVAMLKAYRVIKAEAEAMLGCLPAEQGSPPLESDSRLPEASCMGEGNVKRLHRPTVHIYTKQISGGASSATLPSINNKATADQNDGSSIGREQQKREEEEEQSNQSLMGFFRALLHKAHLYSRRGSNSSTGDEFSFLLPGAEADNQYRLVRDRSLEQQHRGHQEDALRTAFSSNDTLDALEQLNFNAENVYIALSAALQESLNTPDP